MILENLPVNELSHILFSYPPPLEFEFHLRNRRRRRLSLDLRQTLEIRIRKSLIKKNFFVKQKCTKPFLRKRKPINERKRSTTIPLQHWGGPSVRRPTFFLTNVEQVDPCSGTCGRKESASSSSYCSSTAGLSRSFPVYIIRFKKMNTLYRPLIYLVNKFIWQGKQKIIDTYEQSLILDKLWLLCESISFNRLLLLGTSI